MLRGPVRLDSWTPVIGCTITLIPTLVVHILGLSWTSDWRIPYDDDYIPRAAILGENELALPAGRRAEGVRCGNGHN